MPSLPSARLLRTGPPPVLRFDGHALAGEGAGKSVEVHIPARLVSFRLEEFPAASDDILRAAIRLRAERAFAALGPVAVDAILAPPMDGKRTALLAALPRAALDGIHHAARAQGRMVTAVRIAELQAPIPAGGVVEAGGEACLVRVEAGSIRALAPLGRADAPGFAALLTRERLRLGVAEDSPGGAHRSAAIDLLHPVISAPPALLTRPAVRLGLLATGVAAAGILAIGFIALDALAERASATAELERLKPQATVLAARRADLKELGGWFDDRPSLAPGLHALSTALPANGSGDLVRLVRVRQQPGEETVAEGVAGDRAQLMAFLGRLRQDPRISSAEVRTFRSLAKGSDEVGFELVFRMSGSGSKIGELRPPEPPVALTPAILSLRDAGHARHGSSHAQA